MTATPPPARGPVTDTETVLKQNKTPNMCLHVGGWIMVPLEYHTNWKGIFFLFSSSQNFLIIGFTPTALRMRLQCLQFSQKNTE